MQLILVALIASTLVTASTGGSGCQGSNAWTHCAASSSGSTVDLSATQSNSGSSAPSAPSQDSPGPPAYDAPAPQPSPEDCGPLGCRGNYDVVLIPDVTVSDLASFRPATPRLTGEPAGFAVVGMPANLVAAAPVQSIPGTLLDWDVTVRFTPIAYEFDYGDGTTEIRATGGATWAQLGQAQLTPTPTSHVYRERGAYSVSVTVRYAAAVDFGTGTWRPVPGYVTATSGGYGVQALEARSALVDRTCVEDPDGPGC